MSFLKYTRTNISEMRPIDLNDMLIFSIRKKLLFSDGIEVSISKADLENGSPKIGDMIARNPENHKDQWLVAGDYFRSNFKEV